MEQVSFSTNVVNGVAEAAPCGQWDEKVEPVPASGEFAKRADAILAKYPEGTLRGKVASDPGVAALFTAWNKADIKASTIYWGRKSAIYPDRIPMTPQP